MAEPVLREIAGVRQDAPDVERRWFQDDYFDLFLWRSGLGKITAFQLAYDKSGKERVLGWDARHGYLHSAVDGGDGERRPVSGTPLLIAAGRFPKCRVLTEFDARSRDLEPAIRGFVRDKAMRYLQRGRGRTGTGR
jgi:hypothetical protein